jgi:sec-independent protein translocase protein TatC
MTFFGAFSSSLVRFMPRVEETFDQYLKMLLAMVLVFQIPTIVFFLAKMRLVTARFLWRNIKYAILVIFIIAAVLTSSPTTTQKNSARPGVNDDTSATTAVKFQVFISW